MSSSPPIDNKKEDILLVLGKGITLEQIVIYLLLVKTL